jgi:dephospho-CoA kinase
MTSNVKAIRNQLAYVFGNSVPLPLRLALGAVLVAYLITSGVLGFQIGPYDYNHLSAYYEIAYRFWQWGQTHSMQWVAGFNPYLCGGRTLAADPQTPVYHPILLLVGALGPVWALRLEMLVVFFLGTVGLIRWLRWYGLTNEQVAWGALLYTAGGAVVAKFLVGHVTLDFYFLYPWMFYLSYRACDARGQRAYRFYAIYAAVFVYAGLYKPNFVVYGLLPLLVEAILRSILRRSVRPLLLLVAATCISGLVQSASALPAMDFFTRFPRAREHAFVWAPTYAFFSNLILPLKTIPKALYGDFLYLPHEATLFIGPVAFLFALVGISRSPRKPEWQALAGMAFFCFLLGLGFRRHEFALFSPFSWFEGIWPGFSSIRVPVRFWFGAFVFFILLSARGFRLGGQSKRLAVWVLGVLPLVVFSFYHLGKTVAGQESALGFPRQYGVDFTQQNIEDLNRPLRSVQADVGAIECVPNMEIAQARDLHPGSLLQTEGAKDSHNKWKDWSHAQIQANAVAGQVVRFNLNHSPYWKWSGSPAAIVSRPGERLALAPKGADLAGELRFEDPLVRTGLVLSAIGWALLLLLFIIAFGRSPIYRVALTGQIATGKSTLARFLSENGVAVLDMDQIARGLREDPALALRVRQHIPEAWDSKKNVLDNAHLRKAIQENPEKKRWYENLMHGRMREVFEQKCAQLERKGTSLVVCEGSLFLQTGYAEQFNELIVVDAPKDLKLARLQTRNPDWNESERKAWLKTQEPHDIAGYRPATLVINSGSEEKLKQEALQFMGRWASGKNPPLAFLMKTK